MSSRPSPAVTTTRKTLALKRADGEPLNRADIQYDVLHSIFHDEHKVFTDPYPSSSDTKSGTKLCFRDLYIKTILHSPKTTKALKDKMMEFPAFAEDFAMLSILVNVGRINTTMSFFPEMKTTIRTYHPIPALQRTTGNLQDAPRIKHILKSTALEGEQTILPSTPTDIIAKAKAGQAPSTTVMNLIFTLASHSASVGQAHFSDNLDFIDLFLRTDISSPTRARAFLWLCYHYLEIHCSDNDDDYDGDGPSNPFADQRRGNAPSFVFFSDIDSVQENIDPEEEKVLAEKLVTQRSHILRNQGSKDNGKTSSKASAVMAGGDDDPVLSGDETKSKSKRATTKAKSTSTAKEKKAAAEKLRRARLKEKATDRDLNTPVRSPESDDEFNQAALKRATIVLPLQNQYPQQKYQYHLQPQFQPEHQNPYPRVSSITPEPLVTNSQTHRYAPYTKSPVLVAAHVPKHSNKSHLSRQPMTPHRTMLQQAWHVITTTDPLLDSEDELGDEHVRQDCIRRLRVLTRLRGKEPTPELDDRYPMKLDPDPQSVMHRQSIQ